MDLIAFCTAFDKMYTYEYFCHSSKSEIFPNMLLIEMRMNDFYLMSTLWLPKWYIDAHEHHVSAYLILNELHRKLNEAGSVEQFI